MAAFVAKWANHPCYCWCWCSRWCCSLLHTQVLPLARRFFSVRFYCYCWCWCSRWCCCSWTHVLLLILSYVFFLVRFYCYCWCWCSRWCCCSWTHVLPLILSYAFFSVRFYYYYCWCWCSRCTHKFAQVIRKIPSNNKQATKNSWCVICLFLKQFDQWYNIQESARYSFPVSSVSIIKSDQKKSKYY